MSKILVYTDLHLSAKRPSHRIDDYPTSILTKLNEVYEIARDQSVDAVIFGGDFYNSHRIYAYDAINAAMQTSKDVFPKIETGGVPTYMIVGQHDLVGYNKESYDTSTLCFMVKHSPVMHTMWEPVELDDVVLYPCHCFDSFEEHIKKTPTRKKKSILVAHHLITAKPAPFPTFVLDDFLPCKYSAVIFGDYHAGMSPYRDSNGTLVWSPGSIARQAINETERKVKVGILTIERGKDIEVEEIQLQTARPSDEVFSMAMIEHIREHSKMVDTNGFVESIRELEASSTDIYDLIEKAGNQKGIRPEVLNWILAKRKQ